LEAGSRRAATKPSNILFIAVDDLNDWVGHLGGHPNASTPNMDRLASQGVAFERAYCPLPLCCPSRTSILTGRQPTTTGVYCNQVWFRDVPELASLTTLPQHLRANGYRTLTGGKVFHGWAGKWSDPASWDEYYNGAGGTPPPPESVRFSHGLRGKFTARNLNKEFDWGPLDLDLEGTGDGQTAARAASFLSRGGQGPFFLACGFFRPHLPWYAPYRFYDKHPISSIRYPDIKADDLDDVPMAGKAIAGRDFDLLWQSGQWLNAVQGYLASCSFTDACVGMVLDALDASEYRDNTVVVLWSDNGFHLGEKQHLEKLTLWEESGRTPFVIRAPGVARAGGRCPHPVSLVDIYPTLLELCGVPARSDLDGRSLARLLRTPSSPWPWPAVTTYSHGSHAVRAGKYRYIRYGGGGEELYDHTVDPNEWRNLAKERAFASVKQQLAAWLPANEVPPRPQCP